MDHRSSGQENGRRRDHQPFSISILEELSVTCTMTVFMAGRATASLTAHCNFGQFIAEKMATLGLCRTQTQGLKVT